MPCFQRLPPLRFRYGGLGGFKSHYGISGKNYHLRQPCACNNDLGVGVLRLFAAERRVLN